MLLFLYHPYKDRFYWWEVVKLVEQGRLKPVVSETYPLEEVEQALAKLRESPPLGRIVLQSEN